MLANADRALGFDWLALFRFYQRHPWIVTASDWAYLSIGPQNFAVPLLLAATAQRHRLWTVLTACCIAGIITTALFPFFPAASAMPHYGITPGELRDFGIRWPWQVAPMLGGLRDGSITDLAQVQIGLVTFPSFHVYDAIVFAWATWQTRGLRWPVAILNGAMVLSTPIQGSHYFVDVLGGAVLAIASIALAVRLLDARRQDAGQLVDCPG
jgi:membrane-associated phospholipid phosphatase